MSDLINKAISLGLGITMASKEKIQKFVDELVVRGELDTSESKSMVSGLIEKGEEQRAEIKRLVREQVKKVLDDLNVATKQELLQLEQKLEHKLSAMERQDQ